VSSDLSLTGDYLLNKLLDSSSSQSDIIESSDSLLEFLDSGLGSLLVRANKDYF
jgi:hypothetical protein